MHSHMGFLRMLVTALILALVGAAAAGGDSFTKKYAYSKVMANCLGEEAYYSYAKQMHQYAMECKAEFKEGLPDANTTSQVKDSVKVTVNEAPLASFLGSLRGNAAGRAPQYIPIPVYLSPSGQPMPFNPFGQQSGQPMSFNPFALQSGQPMPFNPYAQFQRQKREAMYNGELLQKMVKKVKVKVHTLTCVMEKFGLMDENKNMKFEDWKLEYSQMTKLDAYLRADLIESVDKCKAFSMCLPAGKDSPLPLKFQQMMAAMMCAKKARMEICMKADLKKHISEFDLSDFPTEEDEDAKVEKLLHVLWGADPGSDPLDLLA